MKRPPEKKKKKPEYSATENISVVFMLSNKKNPLLCKGSSTLRVKMYRYLYCKHKKSIKTFRNHFIHFIPRERRKKKTP